MPFTAACEYKINFIYFIEWHFIPEIIFFFNYLKTETTIVWMDFR